MKHSKKPLVSIILPIRNVGGFLRESLKSLSSQSYKEIEIIIVDDMSKDNSFSIVRTLKKKDMRIKAFRNKKHYGLATSLNRALKRTKAPFVAFMNPKDISHKDRIQRQLLFLLSHPKIVALGTQCAYLNKKGKKIGTSTFPKHHEEIQNTLLAGLSILPSSVMINRQLLPKDILKFNNSPAPFIFTELFMKLAYYGQFANSRYILHYHRKKKDSIAKLLKIYLPSFFKLLLKSVAEYEYRPSLRSLFIPLIKQI